MKELVDRLRAILAPSVLGSFICPNTIFHTIALRLCYNVHWCIIHVHTHFGSNNLFYLSCACFCYILSDLALFAEIGMLDTRQTTNH